MSRVSSLEASSTYAGRKLTGTSLAFTFFFANFIFFILMMLALPHETCGFRFIPLHEIMIPGSLPSFRSN
jgi:hypothetical protein